MKRITAILLCILLCVSIVGCSSHSGSVDSSLSLVSELKEDMQTETTDGSVPDTSETDVSEVSKTTDGSADTAVPDKTVETQAETPSTPDIKPSGETSEIVTSQTETSEKPDTSTEANPPKTNAPTESISKEEPEPTETTKPTEIAKPSESETTKPEETTPPAETGKPEETEPPAETEPQAPTDPYAYPFNIEQIRQDCIALGRSYGFTLDESLTPGNSGWAGAETASSNTQGTRLKKFLTEMVAYYSPAYREDLGLPAVNITAFNIYCESTGNGTYRIYFLFLL